VNHPPVAPALATAPATPTPPTVARPAARKRWERTAFLAGVVLLFAVPFAAAPSLTNVLTRILALALLAVSLDLLVGISGMPSLGHAAPFGVGAYVAGITADRLTPWAPVPLVLAVLSAAAFAALVGVVVVRSRGTYLLMLTLAICELVTALAGRLESLTGGTNGLFGIPAITLVPGGEGVQLAGIRYWYVLSVALTGFLVAVTISRSTFGRTLRGIRDNDERMSSLGYPVAAAKYTVFILAGAMAGAAGALYMAQVRFVSPADVGFEMSALALLAVVIGGRGTLWGPVLGTAAVFAVRDEIGPLLGGRGGLLLGALFVLAVYTLPRGIAGIRLWSRK
jgi:branched-chain amino acid transport system permease protein